MEDTENEKCKKNNKTITTEASRNKNKQKQHRK